MRFGLVCLKFGTFSSLSQWPNEKLILQGHIKLFSLMLLPEPLVAPAKGSAFLLKGLGWLGDASSGCISREGERALTWSLIPETWTGGPGTGDKCSEDVVSPSGH